MAPNPLCRGGNGECDCEEYQPPDTPQPGEKILCQECFHGKSKHPSFTKGPLAVQSTDNQDVIRIFNTHSRGITSGSSNGFQLQGKENLHRVTFGDARLEALTGFCPENSESLGSKAKVSTD